MQVRTRHTPSFGVARLLLAPGEPARVESGAMMATSYGVAVEARAQGGLLKSLARAALGGESLFVSTFTAPPQGGWVDVAANLPGDLHVLELDGRVGWCLTRGSWLASSATIQLETQWGGFRNLFGGEGGFLMHAAGQGTVVLSCYGALDVVDLQPGEFVTIDTGHVVAYAETVQSRLRTMSQGLTQSLKSGEGLVFDFAGPGQVLTQTRNPRGLVTWLQANGLGARG
ncbi:TIGR00266 family protein [Streptoalloteichus tenebrarius]|uniref:TIGR00266 family protein n=1 Tax=Streptoalloteichus tenebrarius (strain ATCC 17920 / DSM 40477 / JCM 4838 / CBS 697.72 / NBRC 16177 / NCIMB 11028 / NRRL B-12390 / A12253. 1 / ISP 5477) TaxID=1933 RepID=A0ABT1HVD3_STRSD|nr:TIGR00266 family protein [Streptoalloteichus tenebrarius]MCP2259463.1 TIGR00266 family protein [Streptoalloteichus tenebrarius]BFF01460.1 TIGR00266 family protein [Streptoalloteichus tenebrarius]